MRQEDRLNMALHGWAGGFINRTFIAGRLNRNPNDARVFSIQQTPVVMQSIPVISRTPLPNQFPHGSYVSVFGRIRGKVVLDENGSPTDAGAMVGHLHMRFTNGQEVDPDVAQERLLQSIRRVPASAKIDTNMRAFDLQTPAELTEDIGTKPTTTALSPEAEARMEAATNTDPDDDPYALNKRDNRLIRNGNHVIISGMIGFMDYRECRSDQSRNRVALYVQQNGEIKEAIPVRIYGKQAAIVAANYRPGHLVYISGEIQVDVKKRDDGQIMATPFIKTHSVESAQSIHVKLTSLPDWARQLDEMGRTNAGLAKLTSYTEIKPEEPKEKSAQ